MSNTDNAGQAKEGHSCLSIDQRFKRLFICLHFEKMPQGATEDLTAIQADLTSLRSQLSEAKAKADWVDKWGQTVLKCDGFKSVEPHWKPELRAILPSDGKAKEENKQ